MIHFIDIDDHSPAWVRHVLDVAHRLRDDLRNRGRSAPVLAGKTLAMLFEKPSLRTRVSFEQSMYQLGGNAIVLGDEVGLGKRESVEDFSRVISGLVDGVMARVFEHEKLEKMARFCTVPVVNALSDHSHPCQALADVMTMQDEFGLDLRGRTLAFIGDGNNVARSLACLCAKLGMKFILAAPEGYQIAQRELDGVAKHCGGGELSVVTDPLAAVKNADCLYTDTFVSMGQESEKEERLKVFKDYQINARLLAAAPKHAIVMHCLPAYRGIEITDDVMDGPQSRVFPEAHNRLHAQKGLLAVLMGGQ